MPVEDSIGFRLKPVIVAELDRKLPRRRKLRAKFGQIAVELYEVFALIGWELKKKGSSAVGLEVFDDLEKARVEFTRVFELLVVSDAAPDFQRELEMVRCCRLPRRDRFRRRNT